MAYSAPLVGSFVLVLALGIGDARALRLATWNLDHLAETNGEGCRPRTQADYEILRRYAEKLNADIVAVQNVENGRALARVFDPETWNLEISRRPTQSPPRECPNRPGSNLITQRTGFAVKKPIRYSRNPDLLALDVGGGNKHRYGVDITVEAGAPLRLLAVHLKSGCRAGRADDPDENCTSLFDQQKVLKEWVAERAEDRIPFAILGDFGRQLQDAGDFWQRLDEPNHSLRGLMLSVGRQTPARCRAKYDKFIDFIVLNAQAARFLVPMSFHELRYDGKEEDFPSDRCPVGVELDLHDMEEVAPRPGRITRALKWYRRSAEFPLIANHIYAEAARRISDIKKDEDENVSDDDWVVSIDADETVLDNSLGQLENEYLGLGYDPKRWKRWEARAAAKAVPGAIAFMNHVLESGGKIAVITNRNAEFNEATRDNLIRLGMKDDRGKVCILGRSDVDKKAKNPDACDGQGYRNDKDRRRELLREGDAAACWADDRDGTAKDSWNRKHRFVLWIGDNVEDLPCLSQADARTAGAHGLESGKDYFLLPNPLYGSWIGNAP